MKFGELISRPRREGLAPFDVAFEDSVMPLLSFQVASRAIDALRVVDELAGLLEEMIGQRAGCRLFHTLLERRPPF